MAHAVVFGNPSLEPQSNVLDQFDLGRLAVALLSHASVTVDTQSFRELPALISKMGAENLERELKEKRIRFLCRHRTPAWITHPDLERPTLADIVLLTEEQESPGDLSLSTVARSAVDMDLFFDITAPGSLFEQVAASTTRVDESLAAASRNNLREDLESTEIEPLLREAACAGSLPRTPNHPILEPGPSDTVQMHESCVGVDELERAAGSAALLLSEVYYQLEVAEHNNIDFVYSAPKAFLLANKVATARSRRRQHSSQSAAEVVTRVVELPDIAWMVNNDTLAIKHVLDFAKSDAGPRFRAFMRKFATSEDLSETEILTEITQTLQRVTPFEQAWNSKAGRFTRWVVTTGIGLIPAVGWMLGPMAAAVDQAADAQPGHTFKPTQAVLDKLGKKADHALIEQRRCRRNILPSIERLQRQGYQPTLVVPVDETWDCVTLDVPNEEMHWTLYCAHGDAETAEYLESFFRSCPNPGTSTRQFIDAIADGWDFKGKRFSGSPGDSALSIEVLLQRDAEQRWIRDDGADLGNYLASRSQLRDHSRYQDWVAELRARKPTERPKD